MTKIWFIDEGLDRMGGVERIISTLSNELINKYKVEAISLLKSNDKSYFEFDKRININYLYDKSNLKSKKYKSQKAIYYFYRFFEKFNEYLTIKLKSIKYSKLINKEDIVIYGRVETALEFLPYINKTKRTIVREAIHLEYHKNKNKIKRLFPEKVDVFILSSDENKKSYENFFKNSKIRLEKIYNPLTIIPKIIDSVDNKNIVSVGRYDTHKGYDYLIRAFKLVYEKYNDWKLRIVGDGYYKEKMVDLISELNLTDSVLLIPPTKDIVEELNKSSIYVMASRFEGYANALVEAMSCGLSCISYDWLMGVDDIIKNNENGLIINLSDRYRYFTTYDIIDVDIENLANSVIKLIKERNLRNKLKKEAVKIAESRNKDKIMKKWLEIIEE